MEQKLDETIEQKIILERLNNLIITNQTSHDAILNQVTRINGNVAKNTRWRHYVTAGLVMSNAIIVPIIVAIVLKML
jgi:hypothetical protein